MDWDTAHIVVDTGCVQREDLWDEDLDRVVDKTEVADEMVRRALRVKFLIECEDRWTRDTEARDEDGDPVKADSKEATQWCLTGAMDTVAEKGMPHVQTTFESYVVWTANRLGLSSGNGRDIGSYIAEQEARHDAPHDGFEGYNPTGYLRWLNDLKGIGHEEVMEVVEKACCAANARLFAKEAKCLTIQEAVGESDYYAEMSPEAHR